MPPTRKSYGKYPYTWENFQILDAIREWVRIYDRPPTRRDWSKIWEKGYDGIYPSYVIVKQQFGSMDKAMAEAGFRVGRSINGRPFLIIDASEIPGRGPHPGVNRRKLNEDQVLGMRRMHQSGESCMKIGAYYGVHERTARNAVTGATYKWVADMSTPADGLSK